MRVIGVGILLLAYIVEYVTAVDHSTQFWTSMQFVNDSWYWVENTIYTPVTDSRWELIPNTNFETFALVKSPGKWKADIESASASAVCEGPSGPDATAITIPATTPDYSTQPPVTPACAARTSGPAVYEDLENERCYYAWNIPWPRSNQETICLIDDAYLVTLESDVEKTCLDAWLQAIGHTYEYWLGMEYITDKWYWHVHNTTLVEVTTNHWDFPPNTTVDKYGYGTPAGKWTGDPGEFYANAVCERLPKNVTGTVNAPTTAITPMIPAASAACATSSGIPKVYEDTVNFVCYHTWNNNLRYYDSVTLCRLDNAHLLHLETAAEQTMVEDWLQAIGYTTDAWLGLEYSTDAWYWVDNTTITTAVASPWGMAPNLTTHGYASLAAPGQWMPDNADGHHATICEKKATYPEPKTKEIFRKTALAASELVVLEQVQVDFVIECGVACHRRSDCHVFWEETATRSCTLYDVTQDINYEPYASGVAYFKKMWI